MVCIRTFELCHILAVLHSVDGQESHHGRQSRAPAVISKSRHHLKDGNPFDDRTWLELRIGALDR